jgi:hypothetical protein
MDTNDGRQNIRISAISSRKVPCLELGQREAIRAVFLHRLESYPLREVARLTGIPPGTLRREVAANRRDALKVHGRWCFTWRQLAFIAFHRWTLTQVHEALGDDAATVLPPLLALRTVTVQLPEYVLRALATLAVDESKTLDDYLYAELIDFAGAVRPLMGDRIDGYRRAYLSPVKSRCQSSILLPSIDP